MNSTELWRLGATQMALGIREKRFSSREAVTACLDRANETHDQLNALTEIRPDQALEAADDADKAVSDGQELGPLHGVPVTIKNNADMAGWVNSNGSVALKDNIAKEHSPVVQNLLDAGAIALGRTNCPEFCVRWETNNDLFGQTRNPWNPKVTPGGSSGGAAASLAAGVTPLAHGNDLGGSLRQPAQACGIVSIRPSFGRVPAFVPSEHEAMIGYQLMNTDGPMARSVADVRLGLQVMAGPDKRDPWSIPVPLSKPDPCELPVAIVVDPMGQGIEEQVALGVQHAAEALSAAGYGTVNAEPATLADAVDVWKNIVIGEVFLGLEPAVRDFCGSALRSVIDNYKQAVPDWTPEKYSLAFGERRRVLRDWLNFFEHHSVMVAPVSTKAPQAVDFDIASLDSTYELIESMRMVVPMNALGLPSVVVPVGVRDGLPQAVQVIGGPFQEMRCLEVAEAIEKAVGPITPIEPNA